MIGLLAVCALGGAFALRAYTVTHLPLWSNGPVTALPILPNDIGILDHRMAAVLEIPEIKVRLKRQQGPFLVYVMPKDYVMQGMIADTGGEWQLYKRHHTVAIISHSFPAPFAISENMLIAHISRCRPPPLVIIRRAGGKAFFLRVETSNDTMGPIGPLRESNTRRSPIVSWPTWQSTASPCSKSETSLRRPAGAVSPHRSFDLSVLPEFPASFNRPVIPVAARHSCILATIPYILSRPDLPGSLVRPPPRFA